MEFVVCFSTLSCDILFLLIRIRTTCLCYHCQFHYHPLLSTLYRHEIINLLSFWKPVQSWVLIVRFKWVQKLFKPWSKISTRPIQFLLMLLCVKSPSDLRLTILFSYGLCKKIIIVKIIVNWYRETRLHVKLRRGTFALSLADSNHDFANIQGWNHQCCQCCSSELLTCCTFSVWIKVEWKESLTAGILLSYSCYDTYRTLQTISQLKLSKRLHASAWQLR